METPENDGTEIKEQIYRLANVALLSSKMIQIMEENVRSLEQQQRWIVEEQKRVTEQQQRRDEVMQQLLQAIALLQADVVRIDETHA